jgi:hypothetical protein
MIPRCKSEANKADFERGDFSACVTKDIKARRDRALHGRLLLQYRDVLRLIIDHIQ